MAPDSAGLKSSLAALVAANRAAPLAHIARVLARASAAPPDGSALAEWIFVAGATCLSRAHPQWMLPVSLLPAMRAELAVAAAW